jgi:hypothetical protein
MKCGMLKAYPVIDTMDFEACPTPRPAEIAKDLARVDGLRGAGWRDVFRNKKTGKELNPGQIKKSLCKEPLNVIIERVPIPADDPQKILAGISNDDRAEYREVLASRSDAIMILGLQARGDKLNEAGGIRSGNIRWEEKKFALNLVAARKSLNTFGLDVPRVVHQAAMENDIRFFKQLAICLNPKRQRAEVDWNRVQNLPCFLVDFWTGQHGCPDIPPLCLFSNKALADLCKLALGTAQGDVAVRKWVSRLHLHRLNSLIRDCQKNPQTGRIEFS